MSMDEKVEKLLIPTKSSTDELDCQKSGTALDCDSDGILRFNIIHDAFVINVQYSNLADQIVLIYSRGEPSWRAEWLVLKN